MTYNNFCPYVYVCSHNIEHDLGLQTYRLGLNSFADLVLEIFLDFAKSCEKFINYCSKSQCAANSHFSKWAAGLSKRAFYL